MSEPKCPMCNGLGFISRKVRGLDCAEPCTCRPAAVEVQPKKKQAGKIERMGSTKTMEELEKAWWDK